MPMERAATLSNSSTITTPVVPFDRLGPYALSVLRVVAALLFLEHGLSKLFGFPQPGHMAAFLTLFWFAGAGPLSFDALWRRTRS